MKKKIIVVIGIGGMGMAIARRIGTGCKLILADYDKDKLDAVSKDFTDAGYDVHSKVLDIVNKESVEDLAKMAATMGEIISVVNTAGVSTTINNSKRIFDVNLLGAAYVIGAFEKYVEYGSVGILISSMAGYGGSEDNSELEKQIKAANIEQLATLIEMLSVEETAKAYVLSKRGIQLQVQAAALSWGKKGARILSVSPGIIATPQSQQEMEVHSSMRHLIENGPVKRMGTPEDIAALVEFLNSPSASFITGTDILIDGGQVALMQSIGKITRNY